MGSQTVLMVGLGLVGACIGSFLNVVAYRLPRECMSIAKPRSRCPRCTRFIPWYENLPIASYVLLGGRCRGCKADIPTRYVLVEILTAGLFMFIGWLVLPEAAMGAPLEHGSEMARLGVFLVVTGALIALSLIDLDYRILPDQITLSGIALGLLFSLLVPTIQPSAGPFAETFGVRGAALAHSALGALVGGGGLWLLGWLGSKAFRKEAMGLGDVKMIAAMGAFIGLWVGLALMVAAVFGAVVGVIVLAVKKDRYLPFGPFLALGMLVVLLRGPTVLEMWLGRV